MGLIDHLELLQVVAKNLGIFKLSPASAEF